MQLAFRAAGINPRLLVCARAIRVVLLILLGLTSLAGSAAAMSGDVLQLPRPKPAGQKLTSGLVLQFDSCWCDGPGYRPIRIHVSPQPGTTIAADRTLVIVVQPNTYSRDRAPLSVSQQIEIPAGSQGVDATVSVPQFCHWGELNFDTYEKGELITELCDASPLSIQGPDLRSGYTEPSVLFASDWTAPGQATAAVATGQPAGANFGSQNVPITSSIRAGGESSDPRVQWWRKQFNASSVGVLSINDFPTRWLDYSNLDIVCLSHDQVLQLVQHAPDAWRAIRQWVRTGGSLWVYGMNSEKAKADFAHLDELTRLLEFSDQADSEQGSSWSSPTSESLGEAPQFFPNNRVSLEKQKKKSPSSAGIKWRKLQFGAVVAIGAKVIESGDNPTGNSALEPAIPNGWPKSAMALTNGHGNASWIGRHGLSYWSENGSFWNFQIPGVGVPPVVGFLVLITVFVIVIGPLNFILLRRLRRVNLTMITVPLCALLVVVLLAGYALIHDGLGTRLRAHSFTRLDQVNGQATRHARLSYYAGLTPGGGLTFPSDCAVYPLALAPNFDGYRAEHRGVRWSGDAQELKEGWIAARTPMQLYTVQSHKSTAALNIREAATPPQVENKLGADIQLLVLRGAQGDALYQATDLEAGASAALQATDAGTAQARLASLAAAHTLTVAPEMLQAMQLSSNYGYRFSRYQSYDASAPSNATSLLEEGISTLQGKGDWPLKNRSYIAVLRTMPPDLATGLASPREEASFHVILGSW